MKNTIKSLPVLGPIAVRANAELQKRVRAITYRGSANDWEAHYTKGGTSGAGSYGVLATFKAEVLNSFVERRGVTSVIEYGCGDGNQLSLARYPSYIGLDVSRTAIRMCTDRFATDPSKSFFLYAPDCFVDRSGVFTADLALSLDVIFHLVEDSVYETYMRHLFASARRFVIVYSSDVEAPGYDVGLRHRRWSAWVAGNAPGWTIVERIANPHPFKGDAVTGSHSDFYVCEKAA